jgi:hypothetical protein
VSGTFVYTPAAGTLLGAGANQILSVTFKPNDTATYTSTTATQSLTVKPALLTIEADDQKRKLGTPNPPLTFQYDGFVHNEDPSDITPPTPSTTATTDSPVGIYPITLTGGSAANYTLILKNATLTVRPLDSRGSYFGTFGSGGPWALHVRSNNTAFFVAHRADRRSALFSSFTVDDDGNCAGDGTEIEDGPHGRSAEVPVGKGRSVSVTGGFTLAGQISITGTFTGQFSGITDTLTGAIDPGGGAAAGLYTAAALGTDSGTAYVVVGASGQTVVVITDATGVDGASGTVNHKQQRPALGHHQHVGPDGQRKFDPGRLHDAHHLLRLGRYGHLQQLSGQSLHSHRDGRGPDSHRGLRGRRRGQADPRPCRRTRAQPLWTHRPG